MTCDNCGKNVDCYTMIGKRAFCDSCITMIRAFVDKHHKEICSKDPYYYVGRNTVIGRFVYQNRHLLNIT